MVTVCALLAEALSRLKRTSLSQGECAGIGPACSWHAAPTSGNLTSMERAANPKTAPPPKKTATIVAAAPRSSEEKMRWRPPDPGGS